MSATNHQLNPALTSSVAVPGCGILVVTSLLTDCDVTAPSDDTMEVWCPGCIRSVVFTFGANVLICVKLVDGVTFAVGDNNRLGVVFPPLVACFVVILEPGLAGFCRLVMPGLNLIDVGFERSDTDTLRPETVTDEWRSNPAMLSPCAGTLTIGRFGVVSFRLTGSSLVPYIMSCQFSKVPKQVVPQNHKNLIKFIIKE